uniref:Macrophage-expressed gene 1 protein n=1 Tax=Panagrolaimus davidi TaxID=227884 RepID=A0A914R199_9BILA
MLFLLFLAAFLPLSSSVNPVAVTSYALLNPESEACFKKIAEKSGNSNLVQSLDGMAGVGWDNLMNVVTQPVISSTFSKCQITPDGKFLIPDSIFAIPIQQSQIDQSAQFYDQFNDYWHKTTDDMNVDAKGGYGPFKIGGSYSKKNIDTKYTMFKQNTKVLHATLKHRAYTLVSDLSAGLHPLFKNRLLEIAGYLRRGLTFQAKYLAEMIIRDYGTHYIERAEVGALIEQEDFIQINESEIATSEFEEIKKSASASLKLKVFGDISGSSTETSETNTTAKYKSMIRQSNFRTFGGPSIDRLARINWNKTVENMMIDNLVPLNHKGAFLHSLIVKTHFPELASSELVSLGHLLGNVTRDYYERNVIRGCTNASSTNFNYQANYDDHSCNDVPVKRTIVRSFFEGEEQPPSADPATLPPPPPTTTTTTTTVPPTPLGFDIPPYGGVFQRCTPLGKATSELCEKYSTPNILSAIYSCSNNYVNKTVASIVHTIKSIEKRAGQSCTDDSYFSPDCVDFSFDVLHNHQLLLEIFSCEQGANSPSGTVYFGGIYDENELNPAVGATGCPGQYEAYKIGTKTTVCLSSELQEKRFRIEFGGFFSCQTPAKEAHCPPRFTQYLATVLNDCEVFYCAKSDVSSKNFNAPTIKRPPFMEDSVMLTNNTDGKIVGYINGSYWMEIPVEKAIKSIDQSGNPSHTQLINTWIDKVSTKIDEFYKDANASIEILLDELRKVKQFP